MKKLILLSISLCCLGASAQKIIRVERASAYSTHVFGDNFEGVIFQKEYSSSRLNSILSNGVINAPEDKKQQVDMRKSDRFTPSTDDIILAENILQSNLKLINKKLPSSYWCGPVVYRHLHKYARQYFGFINEKAEKVIYIYCFWDDNEKKKDTYWLENYNLVFDGGSYYWQIKINLTTRQLFNFGVNGSV